MRHSFPINSHGLLLAPCSPPKKAAPAEASKVDVACKHFAFFTSVQMSGMRLLSFHCPSLQAALGIGFTGVMLGVATAL